MSTSDMVAILANGMAHNRTITSSTKSDLAQFQKVLDHVTVNMAKEIGYSIVSFLNRHNKSLE